MNGMSSIVFIQQPGPLPTMVRHPGHWWNLVQEAGYTPQVVDVNHEWWQRLNYFRESIAEARHHYDVPDDGAKWDAFLACLRQSDTYKDVAVYHKAITGICSYLETLSAMQREFEVTVDGGANARFVDYGMVESIVQFAEAKSYLKESYRFAFDHSMIAPDALFLFRILGQRDLSRAALMASIVREVIPNGHTCLYDHSYENGSLQPYLQRFGSETPLLRVFDAIIASHDGRDALVADVAKHRTRGVVQPRQKNTVWISAAREVAYKPFPLIPAFTPLPLVMTRVSERRCYWSRCTYCVQNNKYDDRRGPARSEVGEMVKRVEELWRTGYRYFLFSDEALSPSILAEMCSQFLTNELKIIWAGRSKIERAFTPKLLSDLKAAGCIEILFGLETTDPDVQKLMDKFDPKIDVHATRLVFDAFRRAGVSMHVNLIAGFPGDTLDKTRRTVDFVKDSVQGLPAPTFILNKFVVFENTPVAQDPEKYSIRLRPELRDLPATLPFDYLPSALDSDVPLDKIFQLAEELCELEDWAWIRKEPHGTTTRSMLSGGPHGVFFKSRAAEAAL